MCKKCEHSDQATGGDYAGLDKLAQLDQKKEFDDILTGGVPVTENKKLQSRAQAKYVSYHLARKLSELDSPLHKSYANTLSCGSQIRVVDGRAQAKYCGNRWCLVCNRIRTAQAINTYFPIVNQWPDAHFLTLTIPNMPAGHLPAAIKTMGNVYSSINRRLKRTESIKYKAIRKIECTVNLKENTYHPHYHLIVDSFTAASRIMDNWLEKFPTANIKAQNIKPVDMDSLKELFKYFTKIFTKVEGGGHVANVEKLDTIFQAMYNKRTLRTYGFKKSDYAGEIEAYQEQENKPSEVSILDEIEPLAENLTAIPSDGMYKWQGKDWFNDLTGEQLTTYEPTAKIQALVKNII